MIIELQVQRQRIQGVNQIPRLIVEDSRHFVFLNMDFDEEWDGLTTTVIFSNDHAKGGDVEILWTGKPIEVPEEMLVAGTMRVSCVGVGNEGLYVTTEYMSNGIRVYRAGEQSGLAPGSSVPGLWEQVLATVGSLSALDTENKDSIVDAVNEIHGKAIQSIEQTVYAEADGGVNEFTVTLVDGTKTVLQVMNGRRGNDGKTPIIGANGNWYIYDEEVQDFVDSGYYSGGEAPYIGENGNWWIGTEDSGTSAAGAGLNIMGQVSTEAELPVEDLEAGVGYLVGDGDDALLYVWNGAEWFYKQHLGTVGPPGADGVSPTIAVTEIAGGHRLTITDKAGTKNVDIMDGEVGQTGATGQTGQTGATGEPGKDGVSPTITTAPISGGHRLTFKDATGTKSIDLMNGKDGEDGSDGSDGSNGKDGVSPTISVSVISGGHRLTIKDANGTKTVDLLDGSDGSPGATGERGADGVGIKNVVFKQNTTAGNVYTINLTDGSSYDFTAPVGPKGADGSGGTGGGGSGEDGVGIQSIQLKSEADTGNTYTIILTDGSTYDFVAPAGPSGKDGSNGSDGEPGKDGASVTVESVTESGEDGGSNVVKFSDGKTVTIKNGSKGSDGADGKDGNPGAAGKDGVSVTVSSVSESNADGGMNVVTFSDGKTLNIKNGSKGSDGAPGADGSPGAAGKDGTSVTVSNVSESTEDGGTNVVTFSDGKKLNVKNGSKGSDGEPGAPGEQGERGVTFTPSVDAEGNLSWSNDGGLPNPATVNIRGPGSSFDEDQIDDIIFITVEDIDEICNPQPDEPDEPVYPPNTFQKVRAFQDGKEYILLFGYNGGYYCLSNEAFNDWTVKAAAVSEVKSTDAQITFTTVPVLFTARASGSGFTLHNGSNNIYGEAASHGTALRVNTEPGIVFTVDTSAMGGFDSDEIIAKVDDQAVWLRSSFEAGNTCLKFESANTSIGLDYKDRDATYSTGFLSFVLYEKIS